mmetsp:Transcript_25039/g.56804  ORF Transcript_25039/g.56804 Transcript_25039/m.56804 type:complete len:204 (+) Transcript_25039:444-1055(+)
MFRLLPRHHRDVLPLHSTLPAHFEQHGHGRVHAPAAQDGAGTSAPESLQALPRSVDHPGRVLFGFDYGPLGRGLDDDHGLRPGRLPDADHWPECVGVRGQGGRDHSVVWGHRELHADTVHHHDSGGVGQDCNDGRGGVSQLCGVLLRHVLHHHCCLHHGQFDHGHYQRQADCCSAGGHGDEDAVAGGGESGAGRADLQFSRPL